MVTNKLSSILLVQVKKTYAKNYIQYKYNSICCENSHWDVLPYIETSDFCLPKTPINRPHSTKIFLLSNIFLSTPTFDQNKSLGDPEVNFALYGHTYTKQSRGKGVSFCLYKCEPNHLHVPCHLKYYGFTSTTNFHKYKIICLRIRRGWVTIF